MKKQVNVSLTYLLTFYPEDLGLDDNAPRTTLMDYADMEIDKITMKIQEAVDMMPNDIDTEVCEMR